MELSVEDYSVHCDNNDGYCKRCKEITRFGDTEPDARGYECPACDGRTCMGIEEALMLGFIEIG